MGIHLDNPAGRLHWLLSEIRTKPSSQSVPQAWGEVLGAANDWPELLRRYALVAGLPQEILQQIGAINRSVFPVDLAVRWRKPITDALGVDFSRGVKVEHVTNCFDGETLAYLEICDDVLHRYRRGINVAESDLEQIKEKIGELLADLEADPEIDPDVHDFLLRHARAMARALRDVPIRGAAGIEEALAEGVGDATVLRPQLVERAGPKRRDFLLGMFGAAAVTLQFGTGVLALEQAQESDKAAGEQQAEIERTVEQQAEIAQTIKSLEQGVVPSQTSGATGGPVSLGSSSS